MIKSQVVSWSQAPGSCGELWQGRLDGYPAHVTCPVDIFSEASISLASNTAANGRNKKIIRVSRNGYFTDTAKTRKALTNYLTAKNIDINFDVKITSSLIPGKGMASSTADIIAAVSGLAALLDIKTTEAELADIALKVDPTDGIFLPGISVFDHYDGRIMRTLGPAPAIDVIMLDFGGFVDSGVYASINIRYGKEESKLLHHAFELIDGGIICGDPFTIGEGAAISARVNQKYLPKPALEAVTDYAKKLGAYGVNAAHSGTVVGVLADPSDLGRIASKIRDRFSEAHMMSARLIGGGVKYQVRGS